MSKLFLNDSQIVVAISDEFRSTTNEFLTNLHTMSETKLSSLVVLELNEENTHLEVEVGSLKIILTKVMLNTLDVECIGIEHVLGFTELIEEGCTKWVDREGSSKAI
jgi:hypothetical protein